MTVLYEFCFTQAPQPYKGWHGILDATQKPKMCVQRGMLTNEYEGSEDCLFLNVHVPEVNLNQLIVLFP